MPRKQLKIDVQAEQAASPDDQQLMIYLLGEKNLQDVSSLQRINSQIFNIMINNYMLDMISGDPLLFEKKQSAIPESPSRRNSGNKNTTTFQLSLMSPRTILSPRFDQKADFSDALQQSIDTRKEQLRPEIRSPPLPGGDKVMLLTKGQFYSQPMNEEIEIIEAICKTYPNGITVHQSGQHPALSKALTLAKKYNRITFEDEEDLRIVNDVIFEGIAGVPGFLAWIAVPFILSQYNKTWSIQHIADELLNYGQLITKMFQQTGPSQEQDPNFIITPKILRQWYEDFIKGKDQHERLFNVIKKPDSNKIDVLDLQRVAQILLRLHPGLSFLQSTTQFQLLYAQTVALRIVIEADTNFKGYLTVNDLRKYQTQNGVKHCTPFNFYQQGTLLDSLWQSQFEQDINKNLKCFSYEHFYVFYVTFWELDSDKDKLLSTKDLEKYQKFSLSQLAIRRAVQLLIRLRAQSPELYYQAYQEKQGTLPKSIEELKKFTGQFKDQLLYPDFIRFLIYLENPDLDASLDFWFEVCDLDGDGYIDLADFKAFYKQLKEKQETIGEEVVDVDDIFCQILDYYKGMCRCSNDIDTIKDKQHGYFGQSAISRQDIRQSQARGNIFSVMLHFQRFQFFEMKDPYTIRGFSLEKTIWERYCKRQYDIQVSGSSQDSGY